MDSTRVNRYKPEWCEMLLEHMGRGLSFESFAGIVKISRASLYQYVNYYPEFREAREVGKMMSLLKWEIDGIEGLYDVTMRDDDGKVIGSKKINATMWCANMNNRFGWNKQSKEDEDESKIKNEEKAKAVRELVERIIEAKT